MRSRFAALSPDRHGTRLKVWRKVLVEDFALRHGGGCGGPCLFVGGVFSRAVVCLCLVSDCVTTWLWVRCVGTTRRYGYWLWARGYGHDGTRQPKRSRRCAEKKRKKEIALAPRLCSASLFRVLIMAHGVIVRLDEEGSAIGSWRHATGNA